jgi:hypothetical protein
MITHNPAFAGHIAFWGLISLTLFLVVPAFALPQDELVWKSIPISGSEFPILYLVGTIATLEGVRRLYSTFGKYRDETNKEDDSMRPEKGTTIRSNLKWFIEKMQDVKEVEYTDVPKLIRQTSRITPNAPYQLSTYDREKLARVCAVLIDEFEVLANSHGTHLDALNQTTDRLRGLMALPEEEQLEDILNLTEEALILAKHCRDQFREWFPTDNNYSGDHVWLEIHTHIEYLIAQAKDMEHNWKSAESEKGPLETRIADLDFEVQEWRKATQQLSPTQSPPGSPLQPGHAKMLIANIIKQADLTPVAALLLPSARPIPLTPVTLAQTIQLELNKIRDSIQSVYPQEKLEDFSNLDVFLKNATNWAKRATRYYAGMSGVQATGDQQTLTLRQIWNEIPAGMRPLGGNCPTDIDDFRTWLNSLSRPVVPNRPQGCNHPAELATELGDPIAQPWNTSLTHVRRLVNQPPAGNPPPGRPPPPAPRPDPAPAAGNQEPLFRTSDIPKFGDEDDYWTYRRSMTIFCEATTVGPAQLPIAMARIIASFSGERRKTAMAFDLTEIYHATWEETWPALLQYMDNHFLDRNAWLQQYNHWIGLRYSDHKWGREFVSLYIREHATLNQIAAVQNKRAIPDAEAVQKLVDRVPRRVNEQLRHEHRDWQALANQRQIYEWIIEEWEHAKNLGLLEKAPKKDNPAPARNMNVPVNAPGNTGQPRINWPDLVCDKPCFDTNPPVHPSLRGPWRDLKPEQQRGLHSRCRRPISEHGKGIKGCPQAGQHLFHKGTNTDPAPPARQITQGNNEDQALVAPLGSSSGNE